VAPPQTPHRKAEKGKGNFGLAPSPQNSEKSTFSLTLMIALFSVFATARGAISFRA